MLQFRQCKIEILVALFPDKLVIHIATMKPMVPQTLIGGKSLQHHNDGFQ